MIRRFISFYRPHWKLFIFDMSTALAISALTVTLPFLVRKALNSYMPGEDIQPLVWLVALLALLTFLLAACQYCNMKWGHFLGVRMETDMRDQLFRHLQKLSFSYYDKTKTGNIMSRITNDLFTISEVAHHAPEDLFISLCTIIGAFAFMFTFNWRLALIALIPLPFIIGWGMMYQRRMKEGFRKVRKNVAEINSSVENSIQGIREVKSYTNEIYEIDKFKDVNHNFKKAKENVYGVMAGFFSGIMFMMESYSLLIIIGGIILRNQNLASINDIFTFFLYVRFITDPIRRLVNFNEQYQQGYTAFERFVEIMEVDPDIVDVDKPVEPETVKGEIEFKNVFFKYDDDAEQWTLDDISLMVGSGKTIALVGESGAGKSTLATLVPRFYEAQLGQILIDGYSVMELKQEFLRQNIGIVQQDVFLFDSTIRENIMFGCPDASEEDMLSAARQANILEFIQSLPDGFDTLCGEHGVKLSGGQKQRISIARVFLKNPPVLIFDEATSALDSESERLIRESMDRLCQGRTTIIIAHRLTTVRHADMIYVLKQGRIEESGTHEQLMQRSGYYHSLYSMNML
jgi:ATP-binding cassette subfamily B protein